MKLRLCVLSDPLIVALPTAGGFVRYPHDPADLQPPTPHLLAYVRLPANKRRYSPAIARTLDKHRLLFGVDHSVKIRLRANIPLVIFENIDHGMDVSNHNVMYMTKPSVEQVRLRLYIWLDMGYLKIEPPV